MSRPILVFSAAAAPPVSRPPAPDVPASLKALMDDLQVIALERPVVFAAMVKVVHRMARTKPQLKAHRR